MKNWWLLISLILMFFCISPSCNKKSQKMQETQKNSQEKNDSTQYIEIHTPKSDAPEEINQKKKEKTERKYQNNSEPSEEKSK